MLAMLTGVINESMFENNELRREEKQRQHEEMRKSFGGQCADLFEEINHQENGEAAIEEFYKMAPDVLELLLSVGADVAQGDIMKIIENMDVDCSGTLSIEEFVHAMEKIAEGSTQLSILEVHHAVGEIRRKIKMMAPQFHHIVEQQKKMAKDLHTLAGHSSHSNEEHDKHQMLHKLGQQLGHMDNFMHKIVTSIEDNGADFKHVFSQQIEHLNQSLQRLENHQARLADQNESMYSDLLQHVQANQKALRQMTEQTEDPSKSSKFSRQISQIQKLVQRLADQREEGNESHPQLVFAQQMQEMGEQMHRMMGAREDNANGPLPSQELQNMSHALQRLLDQSDERTTAMKALHRLLEHSDEKTASVVRAAVSQTLSDFQRFTLPQEIKGVLDQREEGISVSVRSALSEQENTIRRALETVIQHEEHMESSIQLGLRRQIQEIGSVVQRLLHSRDSVLRDTREVSFQLANSQQTAEIQSSIKMLAEKEDGIEERLKKALSQQIEEINIGVHGLVHQTESKSEKRFQDIQKQYEQTQANVVSGTTELSGMVLDGIADLLASKLRDLQRELVANQTLVLSRLSINPEWLSASDAGSSGVHTKIT
jgi:hypothetical protein